MWQRAGAVVEIHGAEGAFHGQNWEEAQPLSSFVSFVPSISTNRRNVRKFGVIFHVEEMFGSSSVVM